MWICVKTQDSILLSGCYEARKEARRWTGYGSGKRTGFETNHTPYHRWRFLLHCYDIPRYHKIDKARCYIRGDIVSHTKLTGGSLTPDNHTRWTLSSGVGDVIAALVFRKRRCWSVHGFQFFLIFRDHAGYSLS